MNPCRAPLGRLLVGPRRPVRTVGQVGWASLKNGVLLRLAATDFDVLITVDQNIEFQQNLQTLPLVLVADSNRLESLEPLVPKILATLDVLEPKKLIRVGA